MKRKEEPLYRNHRYNQITSTTQTQYNRRESFIYLSTLPFNHNTVHNIYIYKQHNTTQYNTI